MPDPEIIRVMRAFKRELLHDEKAVMEMMATRWLRVEQRLNAQMQALAMEMSDIRRRGGPVTRETLMAQQRYRQLMIDLQSELERYTIYAESTITTEQRRLTRLGIAHGEHAIDVQLRATFARLPVEVTENMVAATASGPLRTLLVESWPLAAEGLTQELVNGVALGYNPRKTARLMAQAATRSLDRMMTIARTESLRSYRESSRQSYIASGVVEGYKRIATHDSRVCAQCIALEGTTYSLDQIMPTHPNCRCTLLPIVTGVPEPKWQQGETWLREQPADTQREILGAGKYEAWQAGKFDLKEVVQIVPNPTWGDTLRATPLRELAG